MKTKTSWRFTAALLAALFLLLGLIGPLPAFQGLPAGDNTATNNPYQRKNNDNTAEIYGDRNTPPPGFM
jgi:hypothetical protein